MTREEFKVTIPMVSSLDGFITKKDNSISWFKTSDKYDKGVEVRCRKLRDRLKMSHFSTFFKKYAGDSVKPIRPHAYVL